MSLVINLFGGPGVGKSTLAAEIFVHLKKNRISCEYITEYAKDKVWEESIKTLENQIYVFGKQQHKMFSVRNKVDVMICDSPLPLSIIYGDIERDTNLYKLIIEEFNKYDTMNFYLSRETLYESSGRYQTEEGAKLIDIKIKQLLVTNNINIIEHNINDNIEKIIEKIKEKI